MERWKKRIIRAIYRQWIKTDGVSVGDIIHWLGNEPIEIASGVMGCSKKSLYIRFKGWILRWDRKTKKSQT